jgi:hypothetical protein
LHWVLLPTKNAQRNAALWYYTPRARSPSWLLKPASQYAHAYLLPRLSWSWTALLPTYYVNYSCFTSICDLFTDSPSCIQR